MQLTTIALGCFLLGQLSTGTTALPAAESSLRPPARNRLSTPEMLAEAMELPSGHKLSGQPLALLAALSSTTDRKLQIEVIHAYWQLTDAVCVYHFALNHDRQLKLIDGQQGLPEEDAALLRTARASSGALLQEARLAAVAAQHELARLALLSPDGALPLPADCPHVGPYATRFEQLFSRRTAPAATRLIDRTLPIRRLAIERRAAAVLAAEDALASALQSHRMGRLDLSAVLVCVGQHLRQQQALVRSVNFYNCDIGDYALAVAQPGAPARELVGMLIRSGKPPISPLAEQQPSRVEPAGLIEPITTEPVQPEKNVPTRAVPPEDNVPTPAVRPQTPVADPAVPDDKAAAPTGPFLPPATGWAPSTAVEPAKLPLVPIEPAPLQRIPVKVDKPIDDDVSPVAIEPAAGSLSSAPSAEMPSAEMPSAEMPAPTIPALYPGLVDAAPGSRAKQLTLALHWDRSLPEGIGAPISLTKCLADGSPSSRGVVIEAYWAARRRAAEYQAVLVQAQLVDDLAALVEEEGGHESLRLRSAKLVTEAAKHEAHVALIEAQHELAGRIGRASDTLWPLPDTAPHSGPYLLKLEAQPREIAQSWPVRRLAATIPVLTENVRRRAAAVVEADAARAAAVAGFHAGRRSIEQALSGISRQTDETLAFLRTLGDYNRAIAEYALTVLPADATAERVSATLVVR